MLYPQSPIQVLRVDRCVGKCLGLPCRSRGSGDGDAAAPDTSPAPRAGPGAGKWSPFASEADTGPSAAFLPAGHSLLHRSLTVHSDCCACQDITLVMTG